MMMMKMMGMRATSINTAQVFTRLATNGNKSSCVFRMNHSPLFNNNKTNDVNVNMSSTSTTRLYAKRITSATTAVVTPVTTTTTTTINDDEYLMRRNDDSNRSRVKLKRVLDESERKTISGHFQQQQEQEQEVQHQQQQKQQQKKKQKKQKNADTNNDTCQQDDDDDVKSFDDYVKFNNEKERLKTLEKIKRQQIQDTDGNSSIMKLSFADDTLDGEGDNIHNNPNSIRLSRYLARMGICSRRQADELIKSGTIRVNNLPVTDMGFKVSTGDHIEVNGTVISTERLREKVVEPKLYAFNKPRGMLCSRVDSAASDRTRPIQKRATIYEHLHRMGFGHLMSVGRLDYNSEGLLLLTNDGDLKRYLELPNSHLEREYLVRVHGHVTQEHLDQFRRGAFNVDGRNYGPIKAEIRTQMNNKTTWLRVLMYEGKNREIRKVFQHFNMPVSRLVRIRYGPYDLGEMQKSTLKTLTIKPEFLKHCNQQFSSIFGEKPKESGPLLNNDEEDSLFNDESATKVVREDRRHRNNRASGTNRNREKRGM